MKPYRGSIIAFQYTEYALIITVYRVINAAKIAGILQGLSCALQSTLPPIRLFSRRQISVYWIMHYRLTMSSFSPNVRSTVLAIIPLNDP